MFRQPPGPAGFRTRYEQPLWIIMAVVAIVLLIACANIANLMLARREPPSRADAAPRARRHALPDRAPAAGREPAARVSRSGVRAPLRPVGEPDDRRTAVDARSTVVLDLTLDWRVVGFTALVAVVTALLFGVAPALRMRRADPIDALKEQGRTLAGEAVTPLARRSSPCRSRSRSCWSWARDSS